MAGFKNRKKYKVDEIDDSSRLKITKMAKRELLLTVVSIFAVMIVSMGSAFAVFTSFSKSTDFNQVTVGTLKISYNAENDASGGYGDTINLSGAFPTSDSEGLASTPYQFTLKNEGTLSAAYTVSIKDDQDMITEDGCTDNQLDKALVKISINGATPVLLSSLVDVTGSNYIIDTGSMASGETKSYQIKMWITDTAGNEVLGRHFHGKIVIDGNEYKDTTRTVSHAVTIASTTLTDASLATETLTEPAQFEGKLVMQKSSQDFPTAYGLTEWVYDLLLATTYTNATITFHVPTLETTDTVKVYALDTANHNWNEVPATILEAEKLQLTITGNTTIAIVKVA